MQMHSYTNGGPLAATPLPIPTQTIVGAGLANRHLDKRQRAVLAANVLDGLVTFSPSQQQIAAILGVSVPYIQAARGLAPGKRAAILRGWDPTSFADLVHPQRQLQLKLPAPNCASVTNLQLEHVIRTVGIERALDAAVKVKLNT
jgi:hypothetical protein